MCVCVSSVQWGWREGGEGGGGGGGGEWSDGVKLSSVSFPFLPRATRREKGGGRAVGGRGGVG